jgi:hypothetical protein
MPEIKEIARTGDLPALIPSQAPKVIAIGGGKA